MQRSAVEALAVKLGLQIDKATDIEKAENIEPYTIRWAVREPGHKSADFFCTLEDVYDDLSLRILQAEINE